MLTHVEKGCLLAVGQGTWKQGTNRAPPQPGRSAPGTWVAADVTHTPPSLGDVHTERSSSGMPAGPSPWCLREGVRAAACAWPLGSQRGVLVLGMAHVGERLAGGLGKS